MEARTDVNWERSGEIADLLCLEKRQCYKNAVIALCSLEALQAEGFVYVEGYVFDFVAMHHGWLQNDREILDPTLVLSRRPEHPVYFFAAVTYTAKEVKRLATRYETPYVNRDGHGGHSIAAYVEAENAAMDAMFQCYAH